MKSKSVFPIRLAILCAVVLFIDTAFPQGWSTVDDFSYGGDAHNYAMTIAPGGTLSDAGIGVGSLGYRGLVRASADAGTSWSLLDDFLHGGEFRRAGKTTTNQFSRKTDERKETQCKIQPNQIGISRSRGPRW